MNVAEMWSGWVFNDAGWRNDCREVGVHIPYIGKPIDCKPREDK